MWKNVRENENEKRSEKNKCRKEKRKKEQIISRLHVDETKHIKRMLEVPKTKKQNKEKIITTKEAIITTISTYTFILFIYCYVYLVEDRIFLRDFEIGRIEDGTSAKQ